jgi:hypothetical protein
MPSGTGTSKERRTMVDETRIERMIEAMLDRPSARNLNWVAARFGPR